MCMKYLNVNVQCFDRNPLRIFRDAGLSSLVSSVQASDVADGKKSIGKFDIVTFINIRGTGKGDSPDNPVDQGATLDFRIRLTALNPDESQRISYDLRNFSLDLGDTSLIKESCFKYVEKIDVISIDDLQIDHTGKYVIKVLVKESTKELFDVQITHPLLID